MAGPSSEVGYMKFETIESSSHPEIEPEIEAVEATRDSDEVCGLERIECDDIMEHLKDNPGLVVKSLGPEGQIVLPVAVMTSETKKPESPISKPTDKGFSEAAQNSDWYRALRDRDCNALMSLLQSNPCLVAQTGPNGQTVLHAAAERGCLQLLEQIYDLFKPNDQFVDKMFGVKVGLNDLLKAKYGPSEAEARYMAWFTCPTQVWEFLNPSIIIIERFPWTQSFRPYISQHLMDKLDEIMQGEPSKNVFMFLEERYQQDKNYNFVFERKELQFHYACQYLYGGFEEIYVKTIIDGCLELEPSESVIVLTYLFQLHNAQGQTPLHVASNETLGYGCVSELLKLMPSGDAYKECLNAKDVRGWTTLHCVAATKNHSSLDALLKDEGINVNARTTTIGSQLRENYIGMTALHLAILHDDVRTVELLLKHPHTDVNALFYRYIVCGYERIRLGDDDKILERSFWSPLQLAAIMGLSDVVRTLLVLKLCDIYDDGKLQNNNNVEENFRNVSALLLASASGNPDTLRLFLSNPMFNPLVKFEGATALHYATNAMKPTSKDGFRIPEVARILDSIIIYKVGYVLESTDSARLNLNTCRYKEELEDIKLTSTSYFGRQACITMLLQAGVDIWEKDNHNRFAEPGPEAPEEAHLWWHEKIARETLDAKKSLNDAANAISVVAALVATASFVGPLQPPLGYGGDSMEGGVQDTYLSVRVFIVSNNLSFYLAVASILFAIVPSLPIPQEGIYVEWQRAQRTVGVAMFFLLISVLGVLISFGAASNSVVSEGYSLRHDGLSFYPTLVGGFICILGISLFFLRLLRLVFNRNDTIKYLYKTFVKF